MTNFGESGGSGSDGGGSGSGWKIGASTSLIKRAPNNNIQGPGPLNLIFANQF